MYSTNTTIFSPNILQYLQTICNTVLIPVQHEYQGRARVPAMPSRCIPHSNKINFLEFHVLRSLCSCTQNFALRAAQKTFCAPLQSFCFSSAPNLSPDGTLMVPSVLPIDHPPPTPVRQNSPQTYPQTACHCPPCPGICAVSRSFPTQTSVPSCAVN